MKGLYLLRHAKSSWSDSSLADEERPLAPRGRKAASKIRKELSRRGIRPELVLCSSSRRTRETLELIAPALGGAQVETEDELYAAPPDVLLARLQSVPSRIQSVLLIGHNPGLQQLAVSLAEVSPDEKLLTGKFPT